VWVPVFCSASQALPRSPGHQLNPASYRTAPSGRCRSAAARLFADRVGALEDSSSATRQAREDFRFHGSSGPTKRKLASMPVRLSGEKLCALSKNTLTSSSPVDIVERKSDEAEFARPGLHRAPRRSSPARGPERGIGLKSRLQPCQPVAHRVRAEFIAESSIVAGARLSPWFSGRSACRTGSAANTSSASVPRSRTRLDQRHQRARG